MIVTRAHLIATQARSILVPVGLYWASMMATLLLFVLLSRVAVAVAFQHSHIHIPHLHRMSCGARNNRIDGKNRFLLAMARAGDDASRVDATVTVKAADLDDSLGLTDDERTVVNVHRVCSPSVVYVTSVLKPMGSGGGSGSSSRSRGRRQSKWERRGNGAKSKEEEDDDGSGGPRKLPRGSALGSGSGFVVDSDGYIVTNYHVIQRAYEANQVVLNYEKFWDGLAKNATTRVKNSLGGGDSEVMDGIEDIINGTVNAISGRDALMNSDSGGLPAEVFVRFGTNGDGSSGGGAPYLACEIVDVAKELDIAVLKLRNPAVRSMKSLSYGSSSDLLVGQSLLAIGNPFGLDRTITSGLVSALGRSVTGVAGNDIKNCIQTDAAINPGNSGGPLLNLNGEVVGVNTMIISTSGSSAGIGFAVPGDNVKASTDKIVELDKERRAKRSGRKGRGWLGVDVATSSLEGSLRRRISGKGRSADEAGAFVISIASNSPLSRNRDVGSAQGDDDDDDAIEITSIDDGSIRPGDRIVAVGGNSIANGAEFGCEMKRRVEGERLSLTVENADGERRVVYIVLGSIPL